MAEESIDQTKWLVDPPGPGQVSVQVALGEGVELSDEQRGLLDALLASLQQVDEEVAGFTNPCTIVACKPMEITMPCAMLVGSCTQFSACQIEQKARFF
jgi:hypothetical protein